MASRAARYPEETCPADRQYAGSEYKLFTTEIKDPRPVQQTKQDHRSPDVLIFCHPRKTKINKLDTSPGGETHFCNDDFYNAIEKNGDNPMLSKVQVVDPWPSDHNEADFKEDGFAENFIQKHKEQFDYIFIPDCDGEWMSQPEKRSYNLKKTSNMLRSGGILMASKFVLFKESQKTETIEDTQAALNAIEMFKEVRQQKGKYINWIWAKKN